MDWDYHMREMELAESFMEDLIDSFEVIDRRIKEHIIDDIELQRELDNFRSIVEEIQGYYWW